MTDNSIKAMTAGSITLGEGRSAVFLSVPEHPGMIPAKSPWTETLFWDAGWTVCRDASQVPEGSSGSPVFLEVSDLIAGETGAFARTLALTTGQTPGLVTSVTDLDFLSGLALKFGLPVILDLRQRRLFQKTALGALAAGVSAVILPWTSTEEWESFFPQVKSLVFSLERELVRPPKPIYRAEPAVTGAGSVPRKISVAFQGERGAYSELAVFSLFSGDFADAKPLKAFRDVYEAVLKREVDYGLLPLENALAGSIHDNFDLLLQYPDLHIIAETQIRIEHNLIGVPGAKMEDIRKVLSHPQGLAQSAAFLDLHPQWERVPFYDTAGSVAHIAQLGDKSLAAIASSVAASVYGMEILKAGVETNPRNFTRFALIAPREIPSLSRPNKASLVFSTAHSPGALSDCLSILSVHGLNMRKIESRPIHGKPWAYMFYVDVEVPEEDGQFRDAMAELTDKASEFRLLGAYPAR